MSTNFPGANYYIAYETGFPGYFSHRNLNALGIGSIVVNPANLPRLNWYSPDHLPDQ